MKFNLLSRTYHLIPFILMLMGLMITFKSMAQDTDYEDQTIRFQSTYIWQKKPSFQEK